MIPIFAHRGFTARQPEMTRAAFVEAIRWAEATGIRLGLECDVHFSADGELVCLHDLTVDRTSDGTGRACDLTVAELRRLDFSHGRVPVPTCDQRAMVTLADLLAMVSAARNRGVPVDLVVETKHPNARGLDVERRVAAMLAGYGWDQPESGVRVISFDEHALEALGVLLPHLERTFLIQTTLGRWADGDLPEGVRIAGPDLRLLRDDPGYVERAHARGHAVHPWTVNTEEDLRFCLELGVDGVTTDDPDLCARILTAAAPAAR
jgi:glycerophosphoryl diester phosphodiesterase